MQEPGDYLLNNIFIFLGEIVNRPRLVIVIQTCIFKKRNKPLFLLISHVRAQEVLIKDTGPGLSMKQYSTILPPLHSRTHKTTPGGVGGHVGQPGP